MLNFMSPPYFLNKNDYLPKRFFFTFFVFLLMGFLSLFDVLVILLILRERISQNPSTKELHPLCFPKSLKEEC